MKDHAGAGRSGIVTLKVTKSTSCDQQVWQVGEFPKENASFRADLAGTLTIRELEPRPWALRPCAQTAEPYESRRSWWDNNKAGRRWQ